MPGEGHGALASLHFINRSREPPLFTAARAEVKVLHLAHSCDLGLQVHRDEPQTVFELLSVTTNTGQTRAWRNLAPRAAFPTRPWQHPSSQGRILGDKTWLWKVTVTQSSGQSSWRLLVHPFSAVPDGKPSSTLGCAAPARELSVLRITRVTFSVVLCLNSPRQRSRGASGSPMLPPIATEQQKTSSRGWPRATPGHSTWAGASGQDFQGAHERLLLLSPARAEHRARLCPSCSIPSPAAPTAELSPCTEGKGWDRKTHPGKERAALQAAESKGSTRKRSRCG